MRVFLTYIVSLIWRATINSSGRQIEEQRVDEHESKAGQKSGFAHHWKRIAVNTEPKPAGITGNSQKKQQRNPSHIMQKGQLYILHEITLYKPAWCPQVLMFWAFKFSL